MDPLTLAAAGILAEEMGLNPLDLAKGALDWIGTNIFGFGVCSDANKRKKKRQAQALENATLADLINGRRAWSDFSKGDCGEWFKAYAIEEALKRGEAANVVQQQASQNAAAFDEAWFRQSLQPGGANYAGSANQFTNELKARQQARTVEDVLRSPLTQQQAADRASAEAWFRSQFDTSPKLSRPSAASSGLLSTPTGKAGAAVVGLGLLALLAASKKKKGQRR